MIANTHAEEAILIEKANHLTAEDITRNLYGRQPTMTVGELTKFLCGFRNDMEIDALITGAPGVELAYDVTMDRLVLRASSPRQMIFIASTTYGSRA